MPPALVSAVVSPALMQMLPPSLTSPLPTTKEIDPPFPAVADPVVTRTRPLLPVLVVPEQNSSDPLTPISPAFAEATDTMPLDVAVP